MASKCVSVPIMLAFFIYGLNTGQPAASTTVQFAVSTTVQPPLTTTVQPATSVMHAVSTTVQPAVPTIIQSAVSTTVRPEVPITVRPAELTTVPQGFVTSNTTAAAGIIAGQNRDLMFAASGSLEDLFLIYDASTLNESISRSGSLRALFPGVSDEAVSDKKLSGGAIAGIVIGSIAGFVIIIIGLCCWIYISKGTGETAFSSSVFQMSDVR